MANPILILPAIIVSITCAVPAINLKATGKDPLSAMRADPSLIIIAQKHGADDPHGPDPHGDDPNDEQHDRDLPANKAKREHKAPKDVYGGDIPNADQPY